MVKKRTKQLGEERGFNIIVTTCLISVFLIVFYPLWFIIINSFSSALAITQGSVVLFPIGFNLDGYREIFEHNLLIRSFFNTIGYTLSATCLNVVLTVITGFALSRKDLPGYRLISLYFVFTMWFNAGLVPTFLHYKELGLVNSVFALILPGAIQITNMVIVKAYFTNSIPHELLEAAKIDGCSDFRYLLQIAIPLAKPIIAVITLYYAVGHWNAYFNAMIYIQDSNLYPLQLVLRDILASSQNIQNFANMTQEEIAIQENLQQMLKYSVIVASSLPMMMLFPMIQKHFVAGLAAGAVKG